MLSNFLNKIIFWIKLLVLSPGIVVHELAHAFFCLITGTKIYKIKLFQFSEVAGYVEHEEANDLISAFLISFGPLFLNTLISFLLFQKFNLDFYHWKAWLFFYFGVSVGLSAIPSDADGNSFGTYIKRVVSKNFLLFFLFIFYPLVWILNLLNFLKRFKFDWVFVAIIFYFVLFFK